MNPTLPLLDNSNITQFLSFRPAFSNISIKTLDFTNAKPKLDWQLREAEQKAVLKTLGLPAQSL